MRQEEMARSGDRAPQEGFCGAGSPLPAIYPAPPIPQWA